MEFGEDLDSDLLNAKHEFLSRCRDTKNELILSECESLANWVWTHFHRGGTALSAKVRIVLYPRSAVLLFF